MQITDMTGLVFHINPNKIVVVTGPRDHDTDIRHYILGVGQGPIAVAGDAATFVASLPNVTNFANLTFALTNKPFWINAEEVHAIHQVTADILVNNPFAKAVVIAGNSRTPRYVIESVAQVQAAINAAGGDI